MNDKEIIEEAIRLAREGVRVTFPVKGQSMLPFIIGDKERIHDLYNRWRMLAARMWYWLRPVRRYLLAIYKSLYLSK